MKQLVLLLLLNFLLDAAKAQQKTAIKLDAINGGASWIETEFKYADFPFHFERYLADNASFPSIAWNSYYSRDGVQRDLIWQLDADWRLQKNELRKFWKHARFQTGAIYSAQTIPGQSVGTQNAVQIPGGFIRQLDLYSNDMRYDLLGLQLGWKQYWYPFARAKSIGLYSGFSWMHAWAIVNDITQSTYYMQSRSTDAGGYQLISESTVAGPDLEGKNFRWQRWQLPVGIACRIGSRVGIAAEFNAGIYRHVMDGQRGKYQEAHGFSARLGYYF